MAALGEPGPAAGLVVAYRDRQYNLCIDIGQEKRSIPELVQHAIEGIDEGIRRGWL